MLEQDAVLQDRYRIARPLGRGGMGAVYEAVDQKFGSTVALKETLVTNDDLKKAFEREARLLNKLRHAALPVVIDYFTERDTQFLVMQYIPGKDLGALLAERNGAFPLDDVLRWADDLLDALDYLHGHEPPIVHRDIKPQNLKLTPRGEIILLDFGLSKGSSFDMTQATGTGTGSVYGYTPHFAPFEQIKGSGTDGRSDLYSLAATLYVLMTGKMPPDAMTRAESLLLGRPDPLLPADEVSSFVPSAVSSILKKALSMDRELRFASALEMREALREATRGTVVVAYKASTNTLGATQLAGSQSSSQSSSQSGTDATKLAGAGSDAAAAQIPSQPVSIAPASATRWVWPAVALLAVVALAGVVWGPGLFSAKPEPTPEQPPAVEPAFVPLDTMPPLTAFGFDTVLLTPTGAVKERKQLKSRHYFEELTDAETLEMVEIPGGKFTMGSPETEEDRYEDEGPQHPVNIGEFFMSKHEITQRQWRSVAALPRVKRDISAEPSSVKGDNLPVNQISWEDAEEFCLRLSRKARRTYRLPSEAEWEYACRAGTSTVFSFGDTLTPDVANYNGEFTYGAGPKGIFRNQPVPVGSLKVANAFGLYDMHGNVWEWCEGYYSANYADAPSDGQPWVTGPGLDARYRICRGGSFLKLPVDCRSAERFALAPDSRVQNTGLRVVMVAAKASR